MDLNEIQPSWEVFDECETCLAGPKMPCYDLKSKSKNLTPLLNPHKGRKRLKPEDPWHPVIPV